MSQERKQIIHRVDTQLLVREWKPWKRTKGGGAREERDPEEQNAAWIRSKGKRCEVCQRVQGRKDGVKQERAFSEDPQRIRSAWLYIV